MTRRTDMTDREKMIDLIINAKKTDPETGSFAEYLADFLLGYGVKLPTSNPQPCKPLTLDQLREMDGQPVWCEDLEFGCSCWGYWNGDGAIGYFSNFAYDDYGTGWLAYSYPPAHIDRSEWTAAWVPTTDDDGCVWLKCSACEYDLDSMEESNPFCPSCGRAMTEEAWAELERRLRMPEPPEEG